MEAGTSAPNDELAAQTLPESRGWQSKMGQVEGWQVVRVKVKLQSQKPSTRGVHSAPLRGCEEAAMGGSAQTAVLTLGGQGADTPLSLHVTGYSDCTAQTKQPSPQ